jgi:hypothetical protein
MRNAPSRPRQGGGRDHDGQQQPAGVDRDVPRAALALVPAVVPAAGGRDGVGGADGLGVDHGRGRHWATPVGQRGTFTQRWVDPAPRPRAGPPPEPGVDGLVRREVGRQGPPGDPAADQGQDRVQDQAPVPLLGPAPTPAGARPPGAAAPAAPTARRSSSNRGRRAAATDDHHPGHEQGMTRTGTWTIRAPGLLGGLATLDEPPTDRARGRTLAPSGGSARQLTPLPTPSTKARQWRWPCRPRVSTGVAPGRVHCGTGRLVGPQVATPSASERQYQQIGEPCPPTGESA